MRFKQMKVDGKTIDALLIAGGPNFKIYGHEDKLILKIGQNTHVFNENTPEYEIINTYSTLKYHSILDQEKIKKEFLNLIEKLRIRSNPYQVSSYKGDSEYSINATGDAVVGDEVRFEKAVFSGSFRSAKFERFELITGEIIKDSYGDAKQQHTFTLLLPNGQKMLIKGRNLYGNGLWRKPWINENERKEALDEKHRRGNMARSDRRERLGMNPTVRKGSKLEKELESYESLFERNEDENIDTNQLSEYEKMLTYSEKQNPKGVASITTKKLKEIMDEPFKRGTQGADFEAKYGIEEIESEYYRRISKEAEKEMKKQLREQEQYAKSTAKKEKNNIYSTISNFNKLGYKTDHTNWGWYYYDKTNKKYGPFDTIEEMYEKALEPKPKKQFPITLNWEIYESLKETYAFLEIPDFPFYNVRIYFGNFFTVYVNDGYKNLKEKDFKTLDEAVDFAEREFLALVMNDKDYDVEIGREVKA